MPNKPTKRTVELHHVHDGVETKVETQERMVYYRRKDNSFYINWHKGKKTVLFYDGKFIVHIVSKTLRVKTGAELLQEFRDSGLTPQLLTPNELKRYIKP